jgi:hypothetical protein
MFHGNTRGVKSEMYAINKRQQYREWQLLKAVFAAKRFEFALPDPINTTISVKKWDAKMTACVSSIGWTMDKFWRIGAGESEYRKQRFIALYTALYAKN